MFSASTTFLALLSEYTSNYEPQWLAVPGAEWSATGDRYEVELVDLPAFGRRMRLVWHKWRWRWITPRRGLSLRQLERTGLATRGVTTGAERPDG